jgi:hypothetical protein
MAHPASRLYIHSLLHPVLLSGFESTAVHIDRKTYMKYDEDELQVWAK